jgi:hypothetical protein
MFYQREVTMLDRVLNIACAFDWITPALAFAQDFVNGPVADFGIPANAGWSRRDIKRLLSRYGVRVWGLMFSGDTLMFTVPKAQARWAYYLLEREGVPILYAPAEAVNSSPRQKEEQANLTTLLDPAFNFLDKLHDDRF